MGFAEDKVYGHILRNMDKFKNIHVASLVDSLSCLTEADRDELHTRGEVRGSNATAYKLYQHVKCRRGWVTDLINALHQNNAGHLAEELQQVYDLYQTPPPTASAPPAAPNPHVASFPPDAQPVSAQLPFSGPKPAADAPLADPPRCTSPTGGHPPLQRAAATAASPAGSSAASVDVPSTDLDARAPVQEKVSGTGLRRSLLERGFSGLGATSTLSLPVCSVLAAPGGFAHGEAGGQAPSVPFPRAIWGRMQLLLVSSSELPPFSLHAAL